MPFPLQKNGYPEIDQIQWQIHGIFLSLLLSSLVHILTNTGHSFPTPGTNIQL